MNYPISVEDGQSVQALDANERTLAQHGYGVVSGCAVTIQTGTLGAGEAAVSIGSGDLLLDGTTTTKASTSVDLAESDTEPRKDLVVYDVANSTFTSMTGNPEEIDPAGTQRQQAEDPSPPSLASSVDALSKNSEPLLPLAEIWIPSGATGITDEDIADRRISVSRSLDTIGANAVTGGVTDGTTLSDITGSNLSIDSGVLNATDTDTDTRTNVSDDGTQVVSGTSDINFGTNVSVTADGDGSVTVDSTDTDTQSTTTTLYMSDYTTPDDGTADDSAFDSAITDATAGDTIIFDHGVYRLNTSHQITKPLTIKCIDGTVRCTNTTNNNPHIGFQGGGIVNNTTTDTLEDQGDRTLSVVDASIFSVGDRVLVLSQQYSATVNCKMQFAAVESVDTTNNNISLYGGLTQQFPSGSYVYHVDLLKGARMEDVVTDGGGNRHLQFMWCEDATYIGCKISEYLEVSLYALNSWKVTYNNVEATDPLGLASGEGEPIAVYRSNDVYIENAKVYDCRRGIDFAWGSQNAAIVDPIIRGVSLNGISVHQDDEAGTFMITGGEIVCDPNGQSGNCVSMSSNSDLFIDGVRMIGRENALICQGETHATNLTIATTEGVTSPQIASINIKYGDTTIRDCYIDDPNGNYDFPVWVDGSGENMKNITLDIETAHPGANHIYLDSREGDISHVVIRAKLRNLDGSSAGQGIFIRSDTHYSINDVDMSVRMMNFPNQGVRILTGTDSTGTGVIENVTIHDSYFETGLAAIYSDGGSSQGTFNRIRVTDCDCYTGSTSLSFNETISDLFITNNYTSGSITHSGAASGEKTVSGNLT